MWEGGLTKFLPDGGTPQEKNPGCNDTTICGAIRLVTFSTLNGGGGRGIQ